jgi:hypothetical protein
MTASVDVNVSIDLDVDVSASVCVSVLNAEFSDNAGLTDHSRLPERAIFDGRQHADSRRIVSGKSLDWGPGRGELKGFEEGGRREGGMERIGFKRINVPSTYESIGR